MDAFKTGIKQLKTPGKMQLDSFDDGANQDLENFEPIDPPKISKNNSANTEFIPVEDNEQEVQPDDGALSNIDYSRISQNVSSEYANQYVPYFTEVSNSQKVNREGDVLLEKLNYMVHLLEEQKNEKTNNVTEEVVLYCFLGVFVIFITDSFARASKYTR